ncbi:MAG: GTP 3',8-cyclase MoaA [Verrucomicrobiales bacterium]|jgi:cyclic pyranopterin phosphate synthase|nr:GTP 3',8-cyclase MoaA [Verrucomicrobiales bacterium]HQZ28089.1 GTP 3',8-cyclase MoaA [Verrucomicrobiales bacterium]
MDDQFGHHINYLRVSITDRCNERCEYCMPQEEQAWLPRSEVLSYEELLRVIQVGASLGITKLRITGGEPLTRRNVIWFFEQLRKIEGIDDIGISTNGTLLARKDRDGKSTAKALADSGVRSVNISLDTLDPVGYAKTTGRDLFHEVVAGIDAAREAGIEKIKINTVLMRHRNEHELWDLVEFAYERDLLLRFIELMPVSTTEVLTEDNFLATGEAKKLLEFRLGKLVPRPDVRTNGPSSYFEIPETGQLIGFIGAMTNLHFCETCNKLRLTCEGKLRPCLGSHLEFDMREVLRNPEMTDEDVARFFHHVVARKPEMHEFRENYQPGRRMIAIGG